MAAMSKSKQSDKKDDGHMKLRVHFTDADAERLEFARSCASGAYVHRVCRRGRLPCACLTSLPVLPCDDNDGVCCAVLCFVLLLWFQVSLVPTW